MVSEDQLMQAAKDFRLFVCAILEAAIGSRRPFFWTARKDDAGDGLTVTFRLHPTTPASGPTLADFNVDENIVRMPRGEFEERMAEIRDRKRGQND